MRADNVAEVRGGLIENWASQHHGKCVAKAASNGQRLERLTVQVAALREQIERSAPDAPSTWTEEALAENPKTERRARKNLRQRRDGASSGGEE